MVHKEQVLQGIGKIKFKIQQKGNFAYKNGTASLINSPAGPLIATAAHCIYEWRSGKYNFDVHFVSYHNRKLKIKPRKAVLPIGWIEEGDLENDTAFLVLDDSQHNMIYQHFECFDVGFNMEKSALYEVYGFRNTVIPSYRVYSGIGQGLPDEQYKSSMQGVQFKGAGSGLSGGPWLTLNNGKYIQNSVSSIILKPYKDIIWGPYWGEEIKRAYEYAGEINTDKTGLNIYIY